VDVPRTLRAKKAVLERTPALAAVLRASATSSSATSSSATSSSSADMPPPPPRGPVARAAAAFPTPASPSVLLETGRFALAGADLREPSLLLAALDGAGLSRSLPTLFLSEFVASYLSDADGDALLSALAAAFPHSAVALYEAVRPDDRFGRVMVANFAARGAPLASISACPTPAAWESRLRRVGWTGAVAAADMAAVYEALVPVAARRRAAAAEPLDEVEEWRLMMTHCAIAVAHQGDAPPLALVRDGADGAGAGAGAGASPVGGGVRSSSGAVAASPTSPKARVAWPARHSPAVPASFTLVCDTATSLIGVRAVRATDDAGVAAVIRAVMTECGMTAAGFAIHDAEVDAVSAAYTAPRAAYCVVVRRAKAGDPGGAEAVIGGGGVGPLAGVDAATCELRKFYLLPEARGKGAGRAVLAALLDAAVEAGYERVYLETLDRLGDAGRLYAGAGFKRLPGPLGATGHCACDSFWALDLAAWRA
jgi:putative acetyltransferase